MPDNGMTELDLLVGSMFTTLPEEDRESYEAEREWLIDVQNLLRDEGVDVDLLANPGVEIWEGGIERYHDLFLLRLIAAYLENGRDITPLLAPDFEFDEEPDALLAAIWEDQQTTRFPHLIKHQGEGGYYLPVDFPEPIWIEEEPADDNEPIEESVVSFGSSIGLQRELVDLEGMLDQAGVKPEHPVRRCLSVLREAADVSIANDLPIIVW
ncbi:hypothetical protein [Roseiflexus castenholzii]|jgi:hypothetical protein|uniref:Uncharacterized protein n=1 Tax=Roseiflexus castenholzii (strain DSM 13941 / HLO8) TaxID=383372 RepID=A7NLR4_ROSCS|nr:hypothetical protein [Roseiflexus castenholzii]ABU58460.1 conserved hypothetical protein [Roseiflexus castenholzii DSM 13941]